MPGFANGVMNCTNMNFNAGISNIGQFTANGQLAIGSTSGNAIQVSTLTAGSGISITNGPGSITIASTGGTASWQVITSNTTAVAGDNYFLNCSGGSFTVTLPSAPTIGQTVTLSMINAGTNTVSVAYGTSQYIQLGNITSTATSGSITLAKPGDTVQLVYSASNQYVATVIIGNITYA